MIIAVVGSGGKTARIHKLAEDYRKKGKKVLVTTTTHMFAEEDCELSGNVERIIKKLEDCGYCIAGLPAEGGKMKSLDEVTYEKICQFAEVVLVEADGSKGLPVKFPSEREPVIPKNAEEIHIVTGVSAIGKRLGDVCHRKELVMQCLEEKEDTILTATHLQTLVKRAYEEPLIKKHPDKKIKICAGQVNTLYERVVSKFLEEGRDVSIVKPEWFETKPKLVVLGAGHVGKEIANLGKYLDFEVTVIDDRDDFVKKEDLSEVDEIYCHDFDTVEEVFPNVDNAFYVVVTRGHAADRICLEKILNREYAYLGMIGSRKKIDATYDILRKKGFSKEQLEKIHAPIGLKIGARTPREIAMSVAAELILEKNKIYSSTLNEELAVTKEQGVLCIILEKHGSSPRGEGSMMLVTQNGIIGSIGGGILECKVIEAARETSRIKEEVFKLSNEESASQGMICGGSNKILFVPMKYEI